MTESVAIEILEAEKKDINSRCGGVTYPTRTKAIDKGIEALTLMDRLSKELEKFDDHDAWAVGDIKQMLMVWKHDIS